MFKLFGGLVLVIAAMAGVIGVTWLFLDAVGEEWDYCGGGGGSCIAGWKMGIAFTVVAVVAAFVGARVLRLRG